MQHKPSKGLNECQRGDDYPSNPSPNSKTLFVVSFVYGIAHFRIIQNFRFGLWLVVVLGVTNGGWKACGIITR
jgi:hypothetical protein